MAKKQSSAQSIETRRSSEGKAVLKLGTNVKAGAYVGMVVTTGWGTGMPES
jgi:hypothetical protein